MTRNSLSASVKLFFLSIIIFTSQFSKALPENFDRNKSKIENINPVLNTYCPIYSSVNSNIQFKDTENYFILLKNNRSCQDCFIAINNYVHYMKYTVPAKFVVIALIDSNTLERKRNFNSDKILLPDFDDYYFQYNNSTINTFFANYKVDFTPSLLIVRKGNVIYIPYQEIFNYPSLNIAENIQLKIFNLLK